MKTKIIALLFMAFFVWGHSVSADPPNLFETEFFTVSGMIEHGGSYYVVDMATDKIHAFDSNFNQIATFGGKGTGPGKFRESILGIIPFGENLLVHVITADFHITDLSLNYITSLRSSNILRIMVVESVQTGKYEGTNAIFIQTSFINDKSTSIFDYDGNMIAFFPLENSSGFGFKDMVSLVAADPNLVFAWRYINRIEFFDDSFSRVQTCQIPNLPDEAEYKITHFDKNLLDNMPPEMVDILGKGTYTPFGRYASGLIHFAGAVDNSLWVQLNEPNNLKLIEMDASCEVLSKIDIDEAGIVLGIFGNYIFYKSYNSERVFRVRLEPN